MAKPGTPKKANKIGHFDLRKWTTYLTFVDYGVPKSGPFLTLKRDTPKPCHWMHTPNHLWPKIVVIYVYKHVTKWHQITHQITPQKGPKWPEKWFTFWQWPDIEKGPKRWRAFGTKHRDLRNGQIPKSPETSCLGGRQNDPKWPKVDIGVYWTPNDPLLGPS